MAKIKATRVARGLWPLIKRVLTIGIFTIVFFFVLVTSVQESVQQKSIQPLVNDVGLRFFVVTARLYEDAGVILSDVYSEASFFEKLDLASDFLIDLYIIYLWLRILSWLAKKLIIHDDSRTTTSLIVAVIIFFALQYIFLLGGLLFDYLPEVTDYSEGQVFAVPVQSFSKSYFATIEILRPVVGFLDKTEQEEDSLNVQGLNLSTNLTNLPT